MRSKEEELKFEEISGSSPPKVLQFNIQRQNVQKPFKLKRTDLTKGKIAGSGSFCTVHLVEFNDLEQEKKAIRDLDTKLNSKKRQYALKEIIPRLFERENRMKEIFVEKIVLAELDDPSIIKFYQSFKDRHLYFLVEYAPNGSLADFLMR
jgi:serine/threonine protein kinase